jgi:hypothetical protein
MTPVFSYIEVASPFKHHWGGYLSTHILFDLFTQLSQEKVDDPHPFSLTLHVLRLPLDDLYRNLCIAIGDKF